MKILFIEDDLDIKKYVVPFIELDGHEVVFIDDPEDALTHINRIDEYSLIILDMMMLLPSSIPDDEAEETGIALHNRIRKKNKIIPVIVLSALGKEEVWNDLISKENTYYIVKPLDSERSELNDVLHRLSDAK
ncbi:MAG: hypothetical protein CL942_14380 [Desulfovibrio sp.]|nr:hypothetical protein [Desulfovibrio sp.]MBC18225.1 hypothetical protein [Desulfovibrio sp.]|tara:strand:- start:254 stop:652 length:399 start_codon:yes stop_codon:yes gene_type:complete